ncbi:hypothetical protein AB0Y20_01135 [Heyndrickxia oleronia]|uniref:hypothetical protein n=1 Tax=Heyndrickxia oleronia TaxID=38875 RepID=UPI003F1FF4B7
MVIIDNISKSEWSLILQSLHSEYNDSTMSEVFPKRKENIGKLIQKIEMFQSNSRRIDENISKEISDAIFNNRVKINKINERYGIK